MNSELFPTSLTALPQWRIVHQVSAEEAKQRFAQYVILDCIANSSLAELIVFKGGNALRFVYENIRSTLDLDFSSISGFPDDSETIRSLLNTALLFATNRHGIRVRCQSAHRNPKTSSARFPTFQFTCGYAFPGDRLFLNFDTNTRPLPTIVELEISLNEEICETIKKPLISGVSNPLKVCSLEDIVAEKLRSLLQQPKRNRTRRQDVLDIANVWRAHSQIIDITKISMFLLRKSSAREVVAAKTEFNDDVRTRAMTDYEQLQRDAGDSFIPFEEAWRTVLELVFRLNIPD